MLILGQFRLSWKRFLSLLASLFEGASCKHDVNWVYVSNYITALEKIESLPICFLLPVAQVQPLLQLLWINDLMMVLIANGLLDGVQRLLSQLVI